MNSPVLRPRIWMLAAALCIFMGCGREFGPVPENPRVSTSPPGERGGRLTLGIYGTPSTFNPLLYTEDSSPDVTRLLFGSLLIIDAVTQEPTPGLAESWSVAPDNRSWTFRLRKGLRWSDGAPITADDVVFTWNDVMPLTGYDPLGLAGNRAGERAIIVSRIDDLTFRAVTAEVCGPFLEIFGSMPVLPRHAVAAFVSGNQFTNAYSIRIRPDKLVTSGPFVVNEFSRGKFVLLRHNPQFWMTDSRGERLPYFNEILLTNTPDPASAFLAGVINVCEELRADQWTAFEKTKDRPMQLVNLGAGSDREFVWFNQNTNVDRTGRAIVAPEKLKWFRDRKFRQAVSCAIDRDRIAREIHDGRAAPVHGFVSSENKKWFNPDTAVYSYNPDRARALFAEIGIVDRNNDGQMEDAAGNSIRFSLMVSVENPVRGRTAAIIVENMRRLGIDVRMESVNFQTMLERVNRTFNYECAYMGLKGGAADPTSQMNILKSSEVFHQWFPNQSRPSTDWEARIDHLMDVQLRTLDHAGRKKHFDEVQAIWSEEQPMISTVAPWSATAHHPSLGNVRPTVNSAYRSTWNIEELYWRKTD